VEAGLVAIARDDAKGLSSDATGIEPSKRRAAGAVEKPDTLHPTEPGKSKKKLK
jgi:hypothetical protein